MTINYHRQTIRNVLQEQQFAINKFMVDFLKSNAQRLTDDNTVLLSERWLKVSQDDSACLEHYYKRAFSKPNTISLAIENELQKRKVQTLNHRQTLRLAPYFIIYPLYWVAVLSLLLCPMKCIFTSFDKYVKCIKQGCPKAPILVRIQTWS